MSDLLKTIFVACAKHDDADPDNIACGISRLRQAAGVGVLRGDGFRVIEEISPTFTKLYAIVGPELLK